MLRDIYYLLGRVYKRLGNMKFSMKSDYAMRALMTLVFQQDKSPVSIREMAKMNDVPRRFLEQIMLELKEIGYVDSTLGRDGGYFLAKHPSQITMGEVVRHFDGIIAPIGCVSVTNYHKCSQESVCRFRKIPLDIRNYISSLLDNVTLEEISGIEPLKSEEVINLQNSSER
jgi:Rrf2 family protein